MKKIPMHPSEKTCKPKIDYPCPWQYKIIGESGTVIKKLVALHVHEKDYTLTSSNVSSGGRYVSMALELTVQSEARRLELYRLLAEDTTVKVVL
jgi:putative lipoic acid-binding regulatory protein